MIYITWFIWIIGLALAVTWAYGIRQHVSSGRGLTQQTVNQTMLFFASLIGVVALQITPLHLLWLFPLSFVLGMLSLAFPFSMISILGIPFGHLCCVGIDQAESARKREENIELEAEVQGMLKQGKTQGEVVEWLSKRSEGQQ